MKNVLNFFFLGEIICEKSFSQREIIFRQSFSQKEKKLNELFE